MMKALTLSAATVSILLFLVGMSDGFPMSPLQLQRSISRTSSWEGLAIVVNRQNSVDNVSLGQLRQIFSGEKHWWSSNRRVTLVALPRGGAERQTVQRVIYKMADWDVERYFFWKVFRGEIVTSPMILATPADVKSFVSRTPGAVGYLRQSDVDESVKVVRVDGLMPGDDGYPLRLHVRSSSR